MSRTGPALPTTRSGLLSESTPSVGSTSPLAPWLAPIPPCSCSSNRTCWRPTCGTAAFRLRGACGRGCGAELGARFDQADIGYLRPGQTAGKLQNALVGEIDPEKTTVRPIPCGFQEEFAAPETDLDDEIRPPGYPKEIGQRLLRDLFQIAPPVHARNVEFQPTRHSIIAPGANADGKRNRP